MSAAFVRLVQEKVGEVLVGLLSQHDSREAADAAASTLHWVVGALSQPKGPGSAWAHTV